MFEVGGPSLAEAMAAAADFESAAASEMAALVKAACEADVDRDGWFGFQEKVARPGLRRADFDRAAADHLARVLAAYARESCGCATAVAAAHHAPEDFLRHGVAS